MNKLLATSAIALVALSGAASAQSVLERVLGQIDNATNLASVNGTFANIAENIGTPGMETVYVDETNNVVMTEAEYQAGLQSAIDTALLTATYDPDGAGAAGPVNIAILPTEPVRSSYASDAEYNTAYQAYVTAVAAREAAINSTTVSATNTWDSNFDYSETVATGAVEGINGSINNTIDGITDVTQQAIAGTTSAAEWNLPTLNFGDMATTALGAVNTGDITLGVNSAVDEAKTSTTNAISAVVNQLGGSADTGAIILNVASNMTGVNGSINNVMTEVNGNIGNLSTTALGAVNTGTIVSGVDAAVAGIVGSTSGGSNGL